MADTAGSDPAVISQKPAVLIIGGLGMQAPNMSCTISSLLLGRYSCISLLGRAIPTSTHAFSSHWLIEVTPAGTNRTDRFSVQVTSAAF